MSQLRSRFMMTGGWALHLKFEACSRNIEGCIAPSAAKFDQWRANLFDGKKCTLDFIEKIAPDLNRRCPRYGIEFLRPCG